MQLGASLCNEALECRRLELYRWGGGLRSWWVVCGCSVLGKVVGYAGENDHKLIKDVCAWIAWCALIAWIRYDVQRRDFWDKI